MNLKETGKAVEWNGKAKNSNNDEIFRKQ